MDEQADLFGAKGDRDEALSRVAANSGPWFGRALLRIAALECGWVGTGEDIRFEIERVIEPPHHHNVYGSLISQAIKRRLILPTGKWVHMNGPKSHARRTPTYRRT